MKHQHELCGEAALYLFIFRSVNDQWRKVERSSQGGELEGEGRGGGHVSGALLTHLGLSGGECVGLHHSDLFVLNQVSVIRS